MSKNLVAKFSRGRKCIFCGKYTLSRQNDGRYYCINCNKRLSLSKLKRDLEIMHYFCLELSARKASIDLKIDYKSVGRRYMFFRSKITEFLDKEFEKMNGELELDKSYFGGKRKGKRGRGALNKAIVFGILERKGKIYTKVMSNVSAKTLLLEIEEKTNKGSVFYTDQFKSYKSLKQYGVHKEINHQKCFGRGRNHINGIEGFWSYAKERFHKYHGINKENYTLYLKEMEFRYNYRNEDLLNKLIQIVFRSKSVPKMT